MGEGHQLWLLVIQVDRVTTCMNTWVWHGQNHGPSLKPRFEVYSHTPSNLPNWFSVDFPKDVDLLNSVWRAFFSHIVLGKMTKGNILWIVGVGAGGPKFVVSSLDHSPDYWNSICTWCHSWNASIDVIYVCSCKGIYVPASESDQPKLRSQKRGLSRTYAVGHA